MDINKGVCGYDGCRKKLSSPSPTDDERIISCEDHEITRLTAFKYLSRAQAQSHFNTEVELSTGLEKVHECIHKGVVKEINDGYNAKESELYRECGRTYGCYDLNDPPK